MHGRAVEPLCEKRIVHLIVEAAFFGACTNAIHNKADCNFTGGPGGTASAPAAAISQVLVLGYHNTGTSILTKLLLLMGLYAGEPSELALAELLMCLRCWTLSTATTACSEGLEWPSHLRMVRRHQLHEAAWPANQALTCTTLFCLHAEQVATTHFACALYAGGNNPLKYYERYDLLKVLME